LIFEAEPGYTVATGVGGGAAEVHVLGRSPFRVVSANAIVSRKYRPSHSFCSYLFILTRGQDITTGGILGGL
jgi:hypothetical protein